MIQPGEKVEIKTSYKLNASRPHLVTLLIVILANVVVTNTYGIVISLLWLVITTFKKEYSIDRNLYILGEHSNLTSMIQKVRAGKTLGFLSEEKGSRAEIVIFYEIEPETLAYTGFSFDVFSYQAYQLTIHQLRELLRRKGKK